MGGGMPASALAAIVAAPQVSWDIVWHTAGHAPKQATPKLSCHCRNIEEEEEEPLCIDSLVCPGPRGTRSVVVYWDLGSHRTRLVPSWSTTRTSPSASDVTCAQNNR